MSIFLVCKNLSYVLYVAASAETAADSTSAGEVRRKTGPVTSRKRESTDSEVDGPSKKKTGAGVCLKLILYIPV